MVSGNTSPNIAETSSSISEDTAATCDGTPGVEEDAESVCFTSHRHTFQGSSRLPKRIRSYYKQQNSLIDAYENLRNLTDEISDDQKTAKMALLVAKVVAVVLSRSLVVISSMLDSGMDLVSGALMWWSNREIKKTNYYFYPRGRRKLEPVAIVILAVIMSCVSVQVIQESIQKIVIYSMYFYEDKLEVVDRWLREARLAASNASSSCPLYVSSSGRSLNESGGCKVVDTAINLSSTIELVGDLEIAVTRYASHSCAPVFEMPTIVICVITIVTKLILYLICRGIPNHSVQALAKDHFNDVISNTGAVVCGIIGYRLWKYADPVGAIIISFSIIVNWSITAHSQIKMLTGYTARPSFLKQITWIALRHDDRIRGLDRVLAFHFGSRYMVEIHIVLPPDMSICDAHELSQSLQVKVERHPEVERALIQTNHECKWLDDGGMQHPAETVETSSSLNATTSMVVEVEQLDGVF